MGGACQGLGSGQAVGETDFDQDLLAHFVVGQRVGGGVCAYVRRVRYAVRVNALPLVGERAGQSVWV